MAALQQHIMQDAKLRRTIGEGGNALYALVGGRV